MNRADRRLRWRDQGRYMRGRPRRGDRCLQRRVGNRRVGASFAVASSNVKCSRACLHLLPKEPIPLERASH